MRALSTTSLTPALFTSTSGASACNRDRLLDVSERQRDVDRGVAATCSTMPVWTYVRNPCSATSSRYGPGARFDTRYEPSPSVTTLRTAPGVGLGHGDSGAG